MADFDSTSSNPGPQAGNSGGTGASPGPGTSWRQQRRAERWARRAERHGDWGGLPIGGLIVIILCIPLIASSTPGVITGGISPLPSLRSVN